MAAASAAPPVDHIGRVFRRRSQTSHPQPGHEVGEKAERVAVALVEGEVDGAALGGAEQIDDEGRLAAPRPGHQPDHPAAPDRLDQLVQPRPAEDEPLVRQTELRRHRPGPLIHDIGGWHQQDLPRVLFEEPTDGHSLLTQTPGCQ